MRDFSEPLICKCTFLFAKWKKPRIELGTLICPSNPFIFKTSGDYVPWKILWEMLVCALTRFLGSMSSVQCTHSLAHTHTHYHFRCTCFSCPSWLRTVLFSLIFSDSCQLLLVSPIIFTVSWLLNHCLRFSLNVIGMFF